MASDASIVSGSEPVPIGSLKHDPAWKHCQMFKNGDRVQLKCLYCSKVFSGGGIHRIKEHLACQKGNASCCPKVPPEVRGIMLQSLEGVLLKKKKKQKMSEDITTITPDSNEITPLTTTTPDVNTGLQLVGTSRITDVKGEEGMRSKSSERRKRARLDYSPPLLTNDASQWSGGVVVPLAIRKEKHHVHVAISRFLYAVGLPLDAVKSPYFEPMINAVAPSGQELEVPSYHDVRGWILKNSLDDVNGLLEEYKAAWGRTGCSVLVDEWTTESGRTLLNIFVHCSEGTMFLKSFDVSDTVHSSDVLFELLKGVVEEVGVSNVLQVITKNSEHYISAGKRLSETFRSLYWTPCASCSIDLMLEDMGKIEWINVTLEQAKSVTRFIYNHGSVLNIMRRYTGGKDLIQPTLTRSATDFVTLKSMLHLKDSLQVMVNSQDWIDCPLAKHSEGISMMDIILSQSFWSSCFSIVGLLDPLVGVLKSVRSTKRPAVGYILADLHRVKETIKSELFEKKEYLVYWNIIDSRWDPQLQHPLHEAGFFLNPRLYYSLQGDVRDKIPSGMLDCIEKLVPDINVQDKINKELIPYKNAVGDFGRKMAIRAAQTLLPAEWWSTYGGSCPNLARLAIRILSQTCSASVCRLSSIPFDQVHKTKNNLERQRLGDLVFVQYNLHLQQLNLRKSEEPEPMDPISTDCTDLTEDWITDKMELFGSGDSDWVALQQPVANIMQWEPPNDELQDLVAGFDYQEWPTEVKVHVEDDVKS